MLLCLGIWAQAEWYISDNYKGNTMSSNQFRSPDLAYIWWGYTLNTEFSGTAYARVLRPGTILTIVFLKYKNRYQKRSNKKMHLLMSYEYFTWLKHDFFAPCWKKLYRGTNTRSNHLRVHAYESPWCPLSNKPKITRHCQI